MDSLTHVLPNGSMAGRGTKLKRFFLIGYLTGIVVSTTGWVSIFAWITVRVVKWLMA